MDKFHFDILIIGAGPGGVQVALRLHELRRATGSDLRFTMIDRAPEPGSFFQKYPVHGQLISNNKIFTGHEPRGRVSERFDWNSLISADKRFLMRDYSKDFYPKRETVVQMLNDICEYYELPFQGNVQCKEVRRLDWGGFAVETDDGPITCRKLVIATGLRAFVPEIPGIDLATEYAAMMPSEAYQNKRVLIIGKGNSAFECAQDILQQASVIMLASPSPTRLAYRTHYVGSVRAVNAQLVENYQLKHQAALLDCDIQEIRKSGDTYTVRVAYKHAAGEVEELDFDEVISAAGFRGDMATIQHSFDIELMHGKFPQIDGNFQSLQEPDLYFAGALTHGHDYRGFSSSGFIHGFRYNSVVLANHLAHECDVDLPSAPVPAEKFADHLLAEMDQDSGMYLQPGYIGRYYERSENGSWQDLGWRTKRWFDQRPEMQGLSVLVTLEYGGINQFVNPLKIDRQPGVAEASAHIHPVLRVRKTDQFQEHHVEEHLLNQFSTVTRTVQRLREYIDQLNDDSVAMMSAMPEQMAQPSDH